MASQVSVADKAGKDPVAPPEPAYDTATVLIASAPQLLKALEVSQQAIEEASEIMHYEGGQPVNSSRQGATSLPPLHGKMLAFVHAH